MTPAGDVTSDVTDDAAVTCVLLADDAQIDDRVTSLEYKHHVSLQSMKELLLSSVSGRSFTNESAANCSFTKTTPLADSF